MRMRLPIVAAAVLLIASTAFAGASASGKVTKIEGDKVTVSLSGAIPAWAKAGATVSAVGGSPKVLSVKGNEVTMRFGKSKLAQIKVDSNMTLTEADEELQGC